MRLARPIRTIDPDNVRHLFSSGIERGTFRATKEPFDFFVGEEAMHETPVELPEDARAGSH
jgi:hypothetical protein